MKAPHLALAGVGLLLTACLDDGLPNPTPSSVVLGVRLSAPAPQDLRVVAYAALFDQGQDRGVTLVGSNSVAPGSTQGQLFLSTSALDAVQRDPMCFGPVKSADPTHPSLDTRDLDQGTLIVTPDTANTCMVFIAAYRDLNGNNQPEESEVLFDTHDQFVYADRDFTYSGEDAGTHHATERGNRLKGWTLVRHTVIAPSNAPGTYQLSMNSVTPTTSNTYDVFLHEPSNFFTSMSVGGRK